MIAGIDPEQPRVGLECGLEVLELHLVQLRQPTEQLLLLLGRLLRLDLRLEKRWQLRGNTWFSIVAEWMNATLSKEAVSTRCTLAGCEAQTIGPITIPSLGVEGGF